MTSNNTVTLHRKMISLQCPSTAAITLAVCVGIGVACVCSCKVLTTTITMNANHDAVAINIWGAIGTLMTFTAVN